MPRDYFQYIFAAFNQTRNVRFVYAFIIGQIGVLPVRGELAVDIRDVSEIRRNSEFRVFFVALKFNEKFVKRIFFIRIEFYPLHNKIPLKPPSDSRKNKGYFTVIRLNSECVPKRREFAFFRKNLIGKPVKFKR